MVLPMYMDTIDTLKERVKKCIKKDPSLKLKTSPWDWTKVKGFKYKDLEPSLGQMAAALEDALEETA